MGLSGLGDLLLTCSSPQSRNFTFGVNLGRGQKPGDIHGGLAEGVFTAPVLLDMARERVGRHADLGRGRGAARREDECGRGDRSRC